MIILILLLLISFYAYKIIKESLNYNLYAKIIVLPTANKAEIQPLLKKKEPLHIQGPISRDIINEDLNHETLVRALPGYIVCDDKKCVLLSSLTDSSSPNALIYRNEQLAKDADYLKLTRLLDYFSTPSSFNAKCDLSAWRGPTQTMVCHAKNDTTLIVSLQGTTSLYLINPKHSDLKTKHSDLKTTHSDLKTKPLQNLKKYAHKIKLGPQQMVWIPCQWLYFQESDEPVLQSTLTMDTYWTWWYHSLR